MTVAGHCGGRPHPCTLSWIRHDTVIKPIDDCNPKIIGFAAAYGEARERVAAAETVAEAEAAVAAVPTIPSPPEGPVSSVPVTPTVMTPLPPPAQTPPPTAY